MNETYSIVDGILWIHDLSIQSIELLGEPTTEEVDFSVLAACPNLKDLFINYFTLSDNALTQLSRLPIERLALKFCKSDHWPILKAFHTVRELSLFSSDSALPQDILPPNVKLLHLPQVPSNMDYLCGNSSVERIVFAQGYRLFPKALLTMSALKRVTFGQGIPVFVKDALVSRGISVDFDTQEYTSYKAFKQRKIGAS